MKKINIAVINYMMGMVMGVIAVAAWQNPFLYYVVFTPVAIIWFFLINVTIERR